MSEYSKSLDELINTFLEDHKDNDIDLNMLYVARRISRKVLSICNVMDTQETKEAKLMLLEKIKDMLGGVE